MKYLDDILAGIIIIPMLIIIIPFVFVLTLKECLINKQKWQGGKSKCKFNQECQHYQKYGFDCNSGRDVPQCGIYRDVCNGKRERLKLSDDFDMQKFQEENR